MTRRRSASSRARDLLLLVPILLLATGLRFWALGDVPPGLAHDEVANWLIAEDILDGHHALYFTAAYGHEPLYQYLQAATVALFGDHWLGLRYPSAALGLLGLAITTVLARRLFGRTVAALAALYLAVSFWPLFYARVALRAIALPLTAGLAALFLFRLLRPRRSPEARLDWVSSLGLGVCLGLSFYTYMAARALPFVLAAFVVYLALFHRGRMRGRWRYLIVAALLAAALAAPLLSWLATHPGAETRVAEVREPLDRLLAGDGSLVWHNLQANLGMFTFRGDPWPRQNVPGRPIFPDPLNGLLFYIGVGIALWRWRRPGYAFLLIWLAGSLLPSIVTAVAPSSIRDILGLVVVFLFPALALQWIGQHVSVAMRRVPVARLLLFLPPLLLGAMTVSDYFVRWSQNEVVRFDYQTALTAAAQRVDQLEPAVPVVVGGLSVHTMDRPGLELATRTDVGDVRLCDPRETLVIPAAPDGRLLMPEVVPVDVGLRERLLAWGGRETRSPDAPFSEVLLPAGAAVAAELPQQSALRPDGDPLTLPASFDGYLALLAVDWGPVARPGQVVDLLTIWQVESPPDRPLKAFVHLLDAGGVLQAQYDGLASPPAGWASGDLIVQRHTLQLPAALEAGCHTLQIGVYWAPDGDRLSVAGSDQILMGCFEVEAP